MKIVFLTNPTVGHTIFLISLASKSIAMGNDVTFYLPGVYNSLIKKMLNNPSLNIDSKLKKNGIPHKLIPLSLYQGFLVSIIANKRGLDEIMFALKIFIAGARKYTNFLMKEFIADRPDLIIYDYTFFPAIALSEEFTIPRVAVYHSALPFFEYPIPPIGANLKYGKYSINKFNDFLDLLLKNESEVKKKFG